MVFIIGFYSYKINRIKKFLFFIIGIIFCFHTLLVYSLALEINVLYFLLIVSFFILLYFYVDYLNFILLSSSFLIVTISIEFFLSISDIISIHYRPHEKLVELTFDNNLIKKRYKRNVNLKMNVPHGDLKAMDLFSNVSPQARKVNFHTDSFGFRNRNEYRGQKYVLVGDSFIAGNGNTQKDILSEQLSRLHSKNNYNLGMPGDAYSYLENIIDFETQFHNSYEILLFIFE